MLVVAVANWGLATGRGDLVLLPGRHGSASIFGSDASFRDFRSFAYLRLGGGAVSFATRSYWEDVSRQGKLSEASRQLWHGREKGLAVAVWPA